MPESGEKKTAVERPVAGIPLVRRGVVLTALDLLACPAVMAAAILLRYGTDAPEPHWFTAMAWVPFFAAWRVAVAVPSGLYDFRHRLSVSDHAFAGAGAALLGVPPCYLFIALLQLYYMPLAQFSRAAMAADVALTALWFACSRAAVLFLMRRAGRHVRVLLAGPAGDCAALESEMRLHAPALALIAGKAELDGSSSKMDAERLVDEWTGEGRADMVILATAALPHETLSAVVVGFERRGVEVWVNPDMRLALLAGAEVFSLAGLPLVRLGPGGPRPWYGPVKRAADAVFSAMLLAALSPLLLAVAAAVRLTSPGPALYRQERVGLQGRVFRVFKFRTMRRDAEAETGPVLATAEDPRITPLGRLLRRARIDELPQLFNVLRGDMSLVGPRPERPGFSAAFRDEEPLYLHRLLVRPGLTGLAQIHGRYDSDYRQKLRYDLIYLNRMSPVADLRILASTVRSVLTGRGAV